MSSPRSKLEASSLRPFLDRIYVTYNKRVYVNPDPLLFLYEYAEACDRELVALVASSLAYGRVAQILKSVRIVLDVLGPHPRDFLMGVCEAELSEALEGFKHRFSSGRELSLMLSGAREAIERHGSLERCFLAGLSRSDGNILPALSKFASQLSSKFPGGESYLTPSPEKGSACKRLNLMLRWLVRSDEVDPGGWGEVPASKLIVPLDTHMFRIAKGFGLTSRSSADLKSAVEITKGFAAVAPEDPVKYDFSLTRSGIHPEISKSAADFALP